jgi:predicted metal-dependent hydrolase
MKQNIITVQIGNVNIDIHMRVSTRTHRLSLKLHPSDNVVYLTKPPLAQQNDVINFLEKSRGWLAKVLNDRGTNIAFKEGNTIPILGKDHVISYLYAETPSIFQADGHLVVKGFDPIIVPGLVKDWLRTHIYQYLSGASQNFAKQIGKNVGMITVKDTKSRWGSCSHSGNLAYSWRLVLAPQSVAEYVCAHEVAHLMEMNHSPKFWKLVGTLCPDYANQRRWLKVNGKSLFIYG